MNYTLYVNKDGDKDVNLYSNIGSQIKISNGFNRVVIGGRGPYVEFTDNQIVLESFTVPKDQLYRFSDKRIYYIEFRSIDDSNIKLYYQLKTVAYADYKIGMFYISPYELFTKDGQCIVRSKLVEPTESKFFS